ncbi:hypothetical protein [Shewanella sp. ALD9]|jgi:hypothetical protein|uniref:hypothetical protein n=1 Tax=Shewanella sp. ALD9 TaxID=2058330 RepID=UPI000C32DEFB|nr:hypothetical protein [Shewanella sp. ALD9]PKH31980.1 hypothetical protein CXF88_08775 [Shewanella sp. ALD9]
MLDVLNILKERKSESSKDITITTYPKWVDTTADALSLKIYESILLFYKDRQSYIKAHSKKSHYGPGTKGSWQLTKIEIARSVGYSVSSQIFVDKHFSSCLCEEFEKMNEKLLVLKIKKLISTGFRNENKEVIADELSLLRKQYAELEKSKTKDLLDKSLEVLPIQVLERLGLAT